MVFKKLQRSIYLISLSVLVVHVCSYHSDVPLKGPSSRLSQIGLKCESVLVAMELHFKEIFLTECMWS